MNDAVHFSIIICNYNYAQFVGDAIRSVLDQDYPHALMQLIVVDDGSTDGSHDVYAAFADDPRFVAILQDNRGQTAAFAAGARKATGDYICLLDSDDLFLPTKLARVAAWIAKSDVAADDLFLCHDLHIDAIGIQAPQRLSNNWFDVAEVANLEGPFTLQHAAMAFPYSNPSGLVFSRQLLLQCLLAIPEWEFMRGTDGVLCHATLLKTGRVDYLHEPLSSYRIHADNEVASVVDGRYTHRLDLGIRVPKILAYLERWVDSLSHSATERDLRLDYLMRLERRLRRPSASRRLADPKVGVVLLGQDRPPQLGEAQTMLMQSHNNCAMTTASDPQLPELLQMAQAWRESDAEYMVFARHGDQLDRTFIERHLLLRQFGALAAVSCSDIRLISPAGSLVHADVFANSGAWKQELQPIPPLATHLRDWVAPPMAGCMFRRTELLDRLFAYAPSAPVALQAAGFWLVMHFAHHTGGVLRIRKTLSSCRLHDGAGASYGYLSAASDCNGALVSPPVGEAAAWLADFYRSEQALLRHWLPDAWHGRFTEWIVAQQQLVGSMGATTR